MTKNYFNGLADYTAWADNKAIEWLHQITEEQWNMDITSSFSSIKQTAIHIASAEKIWFDFWTGVHEPIYLSTEFKGTKNELIGVWKKASLALNHFMKEYPEENYVQPVIFKYPNGREGQLAFGQSFAHIVNHSTYHRGQLVTLLRQSGFTQLSSIDLATYYISMRK